MSVTLVSNIPDVAAIRSIKKANRELDQSYRLMKSGLRFTTEAQTNGGQTMSVAFETRRSVERSRVQRRQDNRRDKGREDAAAQGTTGPRPATPVAPAAPVGSPSAPALPWPIDPLVPEDVVTVSPQARELLVAHEVLEQLAQRQKERMAARAEAAEAEQQALPAELPESEPT